MSFDVNNRRYTGSKTKLTEWINSVIAKNCINCESFCDIFAGTSIVTDSVINRFNDFYINDFLFSNEIVYKAFYMKMNFSEEKMYNYLHLFY